MFLATTALEQYWNKSKNIFFLGDWCLYGKKVNSLNYLVLDDHWTEHESIPRKAKYIYKIFEKILPAVSKNLNSIHNVRLSENYWKFLIGPWLLSFIGVIYDRFIVIEKALSLDNIEETIVSNKGYAPSTYDEYYKIINYDDYNFIIFSQLISLLNIKLKVKEVDTDPLFNKEESGVSDNSETDINFMQFYKSSVYCIKSILYNLYVSSYNLFYKKSYLQIITSGLSIKQVDSLLSIIKHKKQFIPIIGNAKKNEIENKTEMNLQLRKQLNIASSEKFERVLSNLIPKHMPMEYIELFENNRQKAIQNSLKYNEVKLMLMRSPLENKTSTRFHVSEMIEKGAKVVGCQHGGGYGIKNYLSHEDLEIDISDQYLTWGWKSKKKNVKSFFVTKTGWIKKYKYNSKGNIIIIGASCRKFFMNFAEGQIPFYNKIYLDNSKNLIRNLDSAPKEKLLYRFQWQYGFNEKDKLLNEFPDLNYSTRENDSHFYNLFYNSSLNIATSDYTSHLQSFILNHPTILFWDNEYYEPRKIAKKYYDNLSEAGILYSDPALCAKKINEIHLNPMKWWSSDKVQKAKNEYCNYFCLIANDISSKLANSLEKLIV